MVLYSYLYSKAIIVYAMTEAYVRQVLWHFVTFVCPLLTLLVLAVESAAGASARCYCTLQGQSLSVWARRISIEM